MQAKGYVGRLVEVKKVILYNVCGRLNQCRLGQGCGVGVAGDEVDCLQALVGFSCLAPWHWVLPWLNPRASSGRRECIIYCDRHRLRNVSSQALSAKIYFGTGRAARAARLYSTAHPTAHPQTWLSSFLPRAYTLTQSTRLTAHIYFSPLLWSISTLPFGVDAILQEPERAFNRITTGFRPFSLLSYDRCIQ